MHFSPLVVALACCASSAVAFQASPKLLSRHATALNALSDKEKAEILEKVNAKEKILEKVEDILSYKSEDSGPSPYEGEIEKIFPGCIPNDVLREEVVDLLAGYGFTPENTLLATSLCADELARQLEDDFNQIYGNNFNLGGLSGFPFAGNTGFGAMSAHIPDDGSCLIVYGPHVGVAKDGTVGKVERVGIDLVDNCCGSAIAASNYLKAITDGGAPITMNLQQFTDFQQGAVQELILPHGKRLKEAKDRMVELPLALYDSQDILLREIVTQGAGGGKKNGYALLGGIQINTAPDTSDYFLPLRFDLVNTKGRVTKSLLGKLNRKRNKFKRLLSNLGRS
mmetsp:Transcript_6613/g.10088  ORF Transcript_6613/g.10088 Transcript_6613/m.10088 type:complete len:339 (-) Transcript_6613:183-1199(-)